MVRRGPSFSVVTGALVSLAVAAAALKVAAKFLPERQPNRLELEYSTFVRSSSRQAVDWYPLSEQPFALAKQTDKLIVLEVGSVFSRGSNIMREEFGDTELQRLLKNHFVCIKADAYEAPWLVDAIELNSNLLARANGSFLAVLDSSGRYLENSFEDKPTNVTTYDWLSALALMNASDEKALAKLAAEKEFSRIDRAQAFAESAELDTTLIRKILSNAAAVSSPSAAFPRLLLSVSGPQGCSEWLISLRESPLYDNVNGGFFMPAASNSMRPNYGKTAGYSAEMAAVYARLGGSINAPLFLQTSAQTNTWISKELIGDSGIVFTGVGTDEATLDGSNFYDWNPVEIPGSVRQIRTSASSKSPLRLNQSGDASLERTEAIKRESARLTRVARVVEHPILDTTTYADVNGRTIAAMFRAARTMHDKAIERQAAASYSAASAAFVQTFGDVLHAPLGLGRTTGYAGDYVWFIRAAIENYITTGSETALDDAMKISGRFVELFEHPAGGFVSYLDSQISFAQFVLPVRQIMERDTFSINALAAINFMDLSAITGDSSLKTKAQNTLTAFAGAVEKMNPAPAGYAFALDSYFRPVLLTSGPDAISLARECSTLYPALLCAPAKRGRFDGSGVYVLSQGKRSGPYSIQELRTGEVRP